MAKLSQADDRFSHVLIVLTWLNLIVLTCPIFIVFINAQCYVKAFDCFVKFSHHFVTFSHELPFCNFLAVPWAFPCIYNQLILFYCFVILFLNIFCIFYIFNIFFVTALLSSLDELCSVSLCIFLIVFIVFYEFEAVISTRRVNCLKFRLELIFNYLFHTFL